MNSVFLRIFLSFWLAMGLIVISGSAVTAFTAWTRYDRLQNIDGVAIAETAQGVLKNGGFGALKDWLRENEDANDGVLTFIIDMHGADILGRQLQERIQRRVNRMGALGCLAERGGHPPTRMLVP